METGGRGELLKECMKERAKDEEEGVWTNASNERKAYMWRCGMSENEFQNVGRKIELLKIRDIEVQER